MYIHTYTVVTNVTMLQEPHKSKKVQHANAKNAVLFEAINLIVHLQRSVNLVKPA